MSFNTKLGFNLVDGIAKEITFTEYNTDAKKGLLNRKISINAILLFGTRQEIMKNEDDVFRCFNKVGYIRTKNKEYLTSFYVINELRIHLKHKITSIAKETVIKETPKKRVITAYNWYYSLKLK